MHYGSGFTRKDCDGATLHLKVPACRECNSMIGADGLTFEERQQILKKRLAKKYRKAHLFPDWSDEELAKLDPGILKESVIRSLALRESINARLAYLGAPPPIKKPPTPVITFYPKAEDCWDCKRKISYGACKHCVQRAKDIVRAEEARKELYEQEERKYAAMVAENRRLGSIKGGETNVATHLKRARRAASLQ